MKPYNPYANAYAAAHATDRLTRFQGLTQHFFATQISIFIRLSL